jgi:hypothetical protein
VRWLHNPVRERCRDLDNCCRLCSTTDVLPRRVDARSPEKVFEPSAATIMVDWGLDPLLAVRLLFRTEDPGIAPALV